jgi:hypothetical protein
MQTSSRDTYEWLTLSASRMQRQLGSEGFITFRPPFANYVVNNYVVVPNVLMEIRKCFTDDVLSRGDLPAQYHALLEDALLRHEGTVRERIRLNTQSLFNPLKWFTRGVRVLLGLPVWVLESVGLISKASGDRFKSSRFFQFASGVAALVGFISAVIGLVTGWEPFLVLARKVVPYAF